MTAMVSPRPTDSEAVPVSADTWERVPSEAPELFTYLRRLEETEVHLRFGIGTAEGHRVEVPAASLTLRGTLTVEPTVDRFTVHLDGWGDGDFAWFARRKGRGRTDYWQGAIEYHASEHPALVLYVTAPLDGLEIRTRPLQRDRDRS